MVRDAFDEFDRVLGVLALRRAEDDQPPVPAEEIERLIAERREARAPGAQLRPRRRDSQGPRRARHRPRGLRRRGRGGNEIDQAVSAPSRRRCPARRPRRSSRATARRVAVVHARLSVRDGARRGRGRRGRRRQRVPRLRRRHRRHRHRPLASRTSSRRSSSRRTSTCTCRARTSTTSRRCSWPRRWPRIVPVGGGTGDVRSFFSNSGTEANEAAIKLARYATKRFNIIAFLGSFHGRTLGSLALDVEQVRPAPRLRPDDAGRVPRAVRELLSLSGRAPARERARPSASTTSRIRSSSTSSRPTRSRRSIVEPIQGEGGYVVPPASSTSGCASSRSKHGILLIADEVQSGMGRTGRMFACEHFGLDADIVTVAKGIASGLPLGVTSARADVMTWPPGAHASTFGGNPVSCAAALATIDAAQGRARPQRRGRRRLPASAACARSWTSTRSSATSAARG